MESLNLSLTFALPLYCLPIYLIESSTVVWEALFKIVVVISLDLLDTYI